MHIWLGFVAVAAFIVLCLAYWFLSDPEEVDREEHARVSAGEPSDSNGEHFGQHPNSNLTEQYGDTTETADSTDSD